MEPATCSLANKPRKKTTETSAARQKILETAASLFYQKGIQHVGINEVVTTSGVAKRTLYRWFPSKDRLIEEVMQHCCEQWWLWFETEMRDRGETPKDRLLATFDVVKEWYVRPDFRGCPFINAVMEIADATHPAHQISVQIRELVRIYIMQLAEQLGVRDPVLFSQQYLLLLGGASLMATIEQDPTGANYAQKALLALIETS